MLGNLNIQNCWLKFGYFWNVKTIQIFVLFNARLFSSILLSLRGCFLKVKTLCKPCCLWFALSLGHNDDKMYLTQTHA